MGALKMALDYVRNNFTKPKRRAGAISRSQIAAGLESLEDRRVLSSNGWTPGLTNFEQESNNTAASATLIAQTSTTRPAADVVFTGGIRRANDIDYYRFVLDRASTVQIDLYKLNPANSLDENLDLRLQNSSGTVIRSSARAGFQSERLSQSLTAGTYFIRVNAADADVLGPSYQVRLQTSPRSLPAVNPDPNGRTNGKTQALNLGTIGSNPFNVNRTERLGVTSDTADWYKFTVRAGQESTLRLRYQTTQGSVGNLSYRVENSSGNLIRLTENSLSNRTTKDLSLPTATSRLPAGTYYVRFSSAATANLIYNFRVIAVSNAVANPDPNGRTNGKSQALNLGTIGSNRFDVNRTDRLGVAGDTSDWYKFTVYSGKESTLRLRYSVRQGAIRNLSYRVEDSSGNLIRLKENSLSTATTKDLSLRDSTSRLPPGTYYLRLSSTANANLIYNFRVMAVSNTWVNPDPNGANNSFQQTTHLRHLGRGTTTAVLYDRLTSNDKDDFFAITWDRNLTHVSFRLTVSVTTGDIADLRVKVYRVYNGVPGEMNSLNESRSGNSLTLYSNPFRVASLDSGLIVQITSTTGKANLSYRIES